MKNDNWKTTVLPRVTRTHTFLFLQQTTQTRDTQALLRFLFHYDSRFSLLPVLLLPCWFPLSRQTDRGESERERVGIVFLLTLAGARDCRVGRKENKKKEGKEGKPET